MRFTRLVFAVLLAVLLASCAGPRRETPLASGGAGAPFATPQGRLSAVAWPEVDGWQDDTLLGVTAALRQNCSRLGNQRQWQRVCREANSLDDLDTEGTRRFFETHFTPFQLANADGSVTGLVTGYYEPLLHGSRERRAPYLYALYRWPSRYARGATLPERASLMRSGVLDGSELVYVDDPIEAFFLQVQGSGRIVLDDGEVMRVGFGGTNNRPYRSIGRWLLDHRELGPAQATMQGIKAWAQANPARTEALLDVNPRFVFFREMPANGEGDEEASGPVGALGVPLTPQRSIAVDPSAISLGVPVFLSTTRPLSGQPLNRLVFAQDTGTAIRGSVRADFFWGLGDEAGDQAGKMKQSGRMWLLLPTP